jgi:hypothetical protein
VWPQPGLGRGRLWKQARTGGPAKADGWALLGAWKQKGGRWCTGPSKPPKPSWTAHTAGAIATTGASTVSGQLGRRARTPAAAARCTCQPGLHRPPPPPPPPPPLPCPLSRLPHCKQPRHWACNKQRRECSGVLQCSAPPRRRSGSAARAVRRGACTQAVRGPSAYARGGSLGHPASSARPCRCRAARPAAYCWLLLGPFFLPGPTTVPRRERAGGGGAVGRLPVAGNARGAPPRCRQQPGRAAPPATTTLPAAAPRPTRPRGAARAAPAPAATRRGAPPLRAPPPPRARPPAAPPPPALPRPRTDVHEAAVVLQALAGAASGLLLLVLLGDLRGLAPHLAGTSQGAVNLACARGGRGAGGVGRRPTPRRRGPRPDRTPSRPSGPWNAPMAAACCRVLKGVPWERAGRGGGAALWHARAAEEASGRRTLAPRCAARRGWPKAWGFY